MARTRIAIVGGGMAGLSAAYQLTKTPTLQAQNQVTVYQMGWRLGGKAASGRDALGRNLEHGLHVWFGCYENTFQMIQEVYAARPSIPPPGWALPTWRDAVKPQVFTPIGVHAEDGSWSYWPLTWAVNDGVPGDGTLLPSIWQMIETVLDWILLFLSGTDQPDEAEALAAAGPAPTTPEVPARPGPVLQRAKANVRIAGAQPVRPSLGQLTHILDQIAWARDAHQKTVAAGAPATSRESLLGDVLDVFLAALKGYFFDLYLPDRPFISIDGEDFRAWLIRHGADPTIVATSSVVRVVYDTLFQYAEGDDARPDLAAGTAIGTLFRIAATYKGSSMWLVQAGMGEVIVGPLYQHLLAAGVSFHFFHKLTSIEPAPAGKAQGGRTVETIRFERQAEVLAGDYQPVTVKDGLVLWPSEPDWTQLKDGPAMQKAGVNFESHWCAWPPLPDPVVLTAGKDFDIAILAVALGALKPLNDQDPNPCQGLIEASPAFSDWVNNVGIVPSIGVQLWCGPTTQALGWPRAKPACVSGPEYLDIWADMSQVLAFEPWPEPKPGSLHYLCGTFSTDLYRSPASETGVPAQALTEITAQTADWLNTYSGVAWPAARTPEGFDWSVLVAPQGSQGEARLAAQFLRANIDPTECCTLSGAGTTRFRLHAAESGFSNLILAGEGTAMGLTTSFEGAVMSGAAASRAICGAPAQIIGYDFLDRKPSQGPG
ncbi:MAG: FAD-dependent oxidoreductase [Caulobacteraceae bacterium]